MDAALTIPEDVWDIGRVYFGNEIDSDVEIEAANH